MSDDAYPTRDSAAGLIRRQFRHFNAGELRRAAEALAEHLASGNALFVTIGGAMSTAEIGVSLAEMIRRRLVHGISCTGANLEEDVFCLLLGNEYVPIPNYRDLRSADDASLYEQGLNRVTDVAIPDARIWDKLEAPLLSAWRQAEAQGVRRFPYEYLGAILRDDQLAHEYQGDPRESWVLAALEMDVPVFVPGWEVRISE